MPEKTKPKMPPPKDEAAPFERFEEFTKRIIQVPKSELPTKQKRKKPVTRLSERRR